MINLKQTTCFPAVIFAPKPFSVARFRVVQLEQRQQRFVRKQSSELLDLRDADAADGVAGPGADGDARHDGRRCVVADEGVPELAAKHENCSRPQRPTESSENPSHRAYPRTAGGTNHI